MCVQPGSLTHQLKWHRHRFLFFLRNGRSGKRFAETRGGLPH
jgi:hypothetical protein